ncbi:hypothetical protein GN958_ATG10774, partial [Phytophthora infestans]
LFISYKLWCHYIVALAAVVFFTGGTAVFLKRALRTHTKATAADEERAYSPSLSVSENLRSWMHTIEHFRDSFLTMRLRCWPLDKGLSGILSNPNLKPFEYFLKLTDGAPRQALIKKLTTQYGDEKVAIFF